MRQFVEIESRVDLCLQLKVAASEFNYGVVLDTASQYRDVSVGNILGQYDFIAAIGSLDVAYNLSTIKQLQLENPDWWFGVIAYDYVNKITEFKSSIKQAFNLPLCTFFKPRYLVISDVKGCRIGYLPDFDSEVTTMQWLDSLSLDGGDDLQKIPQGIDFKPTLMYDEYISRVKSIQLHIARGDIYEMNFCLGYNGYVDNLDTVGLYNNLLKASPVPFAAYAHLGITYIMSASPERYIFKHGDVVYSQPIKGTAPRSLCKAVDNENKKALKNSAKELSENVMIVDLVRNDLAKIATRGSVNVDELCGIYGYKQVFQMVSTISAQLAQGKDWLDVINATFPMGSMTGAPKNSAVNLIDVFEEGARGYYSGTIGYIDPNGDFDFSVLIRSLFYESTSGRLSFNVGSAITALSDAEAEYNECMLKAKAINEVLKLGI